MGGGGDEDRNYSGNMVLGCVEGCGRKKCVEGLDVEPAVCKDAVVHLVRSCVKACPERQKGERCGGKSSAFQCYLKRFHF